MSTATKIYKTSEKVQHELQILGFSKIFNWIDYQFFKKETALEFNQVQAIVDLFVYYSCDESDFAEYLF